MLTTKFKKLHPKAIAPTRAHDTDSGYDIYAVDIKKTCGDVIFFGTGISVQPPPGYYFKVYPRSSISKTNGIFANSVGIIDEDYTGEIHIAIKVFSGKFYFEGNNSFLDISDSLIQDRPPVKIAQLVLEKRYDTCFEEQLIDFEQTAR